MSVEARTDERFQVDRERFNHTVTAGVANPLVASAFRVVDRGLFVPEEFKHLAYVDEVVPLGDTSSISQPISVVAPMLDNLGLTGKGRVLEVGAGSGYVDALLSHCADSVVAVDYDQVLVEEARDRLRAQDCTNVSIVCGDGALGWPEAAPYDSILVSAATTDIPQALFDQLKSNGTIVLPVKKRANTEQYLVVGRKEKGRLIVRMLEDVTFIPLVSNVHGGFNCDTSVERNFRIIAGTTGIKTYFRRYLQTYSGELFMNMYDMREMEMVIEEENEQERTRRLIPELFGLE